MTSNTFDPARFLAAQGSVYPHVLRELRDGRKASHWMWFIFPQVAGLGRSSMAERYAIADLDKAKAFATHPILGARLRECVTLVNGHAGKSAHDIFGSPDDLKFRSSMTLFSLAEPAERCFQDALVKYFDGKPDPLTLAKLGR